MIDEAAEIANSTQVNTFSTAPLLDIKLPVVKSFVLKADLALQSNGNFAEPARADPNHILRSILMQLSSSDMDTPIREPVVLAYHERVQEARGGQPEVLTLNECTDIILQLLEDNPTIIVVDALDECDAVLRQDLILSFRRIIEESPSVLKLFLSSRDDRDIVTKMKTASEVYIEATDNRTDIQNFVVYQVKKAIEEERILNGMVSERLKGEIIRTLISKASGM